MLYKRLLLHIYSIHNHNTNIYCVKNSAHKLIHVHYCRHECMCEHKILTTGNVKGANNNFSHRIISFSSRYAFPYLLC